MMKTREELEARRNEIVELMDEDGADLDALEAEAREVRSALDRLIEDEKKRAEIRSVIASGAGVVTKEITEKEEAGRKKTEVRSTDEYINAYARYVKTGDAKECRALLSTNAPAGGQVPVPTIIEDRIRTAWEKNGLLERVRRTFVKGNLQVGFELSATDASIHEEGAAAPLEETLTFGVVTLTPKTIKKWIRVSDEALDMGGREFLEYLYDEITDKIVKKAEKELLDEIINAPSTSTGTAVGVADITGTATDISIVAKATANLREDAERPMCVMNRLTHAEFISAMASNHYMFDPFDGVDVHYNNSLPAYGEATDGDTWMIVGDFGGGAQANFPNGDDVKLKYDDLTDAESDLVKIVGRMYVAIGLVNEKSFVRVKK